jgi:hypothetical protein
MRWERRPGGLEVYRPRGAEPDILGRSAPIAKLRRQKSPRGGRFVHLALDGAALMPAIRAFAPASVSNVACGFDVLGFAVDGPGDEVVAESRARPLSPATAVACLETRRRTPPVSPSRRSSREPVRVSAASP